MTADSDVGIDENDSAALGTTSEATASTPTPEPTGTGPSPAARRPPSARLSAPATKSIHSALRSRCARCCGGAPPSAVFSVSALAPRCCQLATSVLVTTAKAESPPNTGPCPVLASTDDTEPVTADHHAPGACRSAAPMNFKNIFRAAH